MKFHSELIKEQINQVVFRLDLIPENESDTKVLERLELQEGDVSDQMIATIVLAKARELQEKTKLDWRYDIEKKKGFSSFYIHLKEE